MHRERIGADSHHLAKKIRDQDTTRSLTATELDRRRWRRSGEGQPQNQGKLQAQEHAHNAAYEEAKAGEAVDEERKLAREAMVMSWDTQPVLIKMIWMMRVAATGQ